MSASGIIYALDLGVRSGFAYGAAGKKPRAGAIVLKARGEHRAVAFSNMIAMLSDHWSAQKPQLVVKERWWGLGASGARGNSEDVVYMHVGLHAVVEGMCGRFGVPWREAAASTIRKHFIGTGAGAPRAPRGVTLSRADKAAQREATKEAIRQRCRLLGLMTKDPTNPLYGDDNLADALATHDWACATFAKRSVSASEFHFFGEETAHG